MNNIDSIKEIAKQLNNFKFIDVMERKISKNDIDLINDNNIIRVLHNKGFNIQIRKAYKLTMVCGVPALLFGDASYMVADDLLGKHPFELNAEETVDYVNGLLGYDDLD